MKEHIGQPRDQAPKYDATLNFIAAHPQWWVEQTPPKPAHNPMPPPAPRDLSKPAIVWRPADDPEKVFTLENPQTLDYVLEGNGWDKKDLYGKWQGKWDDDALYLSVRVYDSKRVHDSADPLDDDSIELFLDADNSRTDHMDGKNDFHLIFACDQEQVVLGKNSAPLSAAALQQHQC